MPIPKDLSIHGGSPYGLYIDTVGMDFYLIKEEWVEFPPEYNMSQFLISTHGQLWDKKESKIRQPLLLNDRFYYFKFYDDLSRSLTVRVCDLVASVFIPNHDKYPYVNFINKVTSEYSMHNLCWSTTPENKQDLALTSKNMRPVYRISSNGSERIKYIGIADAAEKNNICVTSIGRACKVNYEDLNKSGTEKRNYTAGGFRWEYADIDPLQGEVWGSVYEVFPLLEDTQVSNYGRVRLGSNSSSPGSIVQGRWIHTKMELTYNNLNYDLGLLVLIAMTPKDSKIKIDFTQFSVKYLDKNLRNNFIDNLQLVPKGEKVTKPVVNLNIPRRIVQIDSEGKEIAIFGTLKEAARAINISPNTMCSICKDGERAGNYYWRYEHEIRPVSIYIKSPICLNLSSCFDGAIQDEKVCQVKNKFLNNVNMKQPNCIPQTRQDYYNIYFYLMNSNHDYYSSEDKVIWVNFPEEMNFSKYMISPCGKIWSKIAGKTLEIKTDSAGYKTVSLYPDINIGAKFKFIHRLVAEVFIPNDDPVNKNTVDHINRDRGDTLVTNLRWATKSEQQQNKDTNRGGMKRPVDQYDLNGNLIGSFKSITEASEKCQINHNKIREACKGQNVGADDYIWEYADMTPLPDEKIWSPITYPGFEGFHYSNFGRIRRPNGSITIGHVRKGYYVITNLGQTVNVSKLVCFSAHGPPKDKEYVVNHKDGCKSNNAPNNLEWVTLSYNTQHAHDTGLVPRTRLTTCKRYSILKISLTGEICQKFNSLYEVTEAGYDHNSICNSLRNYNIISNGYRWVYEHQYNKGKFNVIPGYIELE